MVTRDLEVFILMPREVVRPAQSGLRLSAISGGIAGSYLRFFCLGAVKIGIFPRVSCESAMSLTMDEYAVLGDKFGHWTCG